MECEDSLIEQPQHPRCHSESAADKESLAKQPQHPCCHSESAAFGLSFRRTQVVILSEAKNLSVELRKHQRDSSGQPPALRMTLRELPHWFFPAGTRRFNSSNQFCTTMRLLGALVCSVRALITRNRRPSAEMSYERKMNPWPLSDHA